MAAIAQQDQKKRTVEVNRKELLVILESNRIKHISEYEEAMAGYKDQLLASLDKAFKAAKETLQAKYEKTKKQVEAFTDEDIAKQCDYFTLVSDITVNMKVPRSYAKEYDEAIDMATWDVRETLELSYAEFTCFVRDQWDWKSDFLAVSAMYKAG